jgi:hypothetical protein
VAYVVGLLHHRERPLRRLVGVQGSLPVLRHRLVGLGQLDVEVQPLELLAEPGDVLLGGVAGGVHVGGAELWLPARGDLRASRRAHHEPERRGEEDQQEELHASRLPTGRERAEREGLAGERPSAAVRCRTRGLGVGKCENGVGRR